MNKRISLYTVAAIVYITLISGIQIGNIGNKAEVIFDALYVFKVFSGITLPLILGYLAGRSDSKEIKNS